MSRCPTWPGASTADDRQVVSVRPILATNTSSLSVGDLSAAVDNCSHFIGMHFFNPVPASKLKGERGEGI
ncbi:3-hydroxyacyl-CoA dehydrogenase NAD-binding domain-containing protein [Nocardia sp. CA-120079]|uniref:3-hydroxyacyl-CoA dehydrogenase NAD-binding domain-containing protein n=1 Tax=Nocardia sp. CA-120079 TaxID=3239974 RepID=UPI003D99666B